MWALSIEKPRRGNRGQTDSKRKGTALLSEWLKKLRAPILEVLGAQHELQPVENCRASDLVTRNKSKASAAGLQLDQPLGLMT